jgi:hypothetical protein
MYGHLHMFKDLADIIIKQHRYFQTNLTQLNIVQERMNNINTWITENMDASIELYHPSTREIKIDSYELDHCQQMGEKVDKETTRSIPICSRIHKEINELLKLCRMPQLEELQKNLTMEELVDKVQDSTSHRRFVTEATTIVTKDLIEQHLIQLKNVHTMF